LSVFARSDGQARRIHAEHFGSEEIAEISPFFPLFFNNNARDDSWEARISGSIFQKLIGELVEKPFESPRSRD